MLEPVDRLNHRLALERATLIRDIAETARSCADYTGRAAFSPQVMQALAKVPRHAFVPDGLRDLAYCDGPLAIGYGQTISQPFIVALMTDLLDLAPASSVLEVGTGSGYQAAVLAEIVEQVYTLERLPELASVARERLVRQGYNNVEVIQADGFFGYAARAPYDGIVVTAAAEAIPPSLIEQLKPGGRLVIPLGPPASTQSLVRAIKQRDGGLSRRDILPVAFVPFCH